MRKKRMLLYAAVMTITVTMSGCGGCNKPSVVAPVATIAPAEDLPSGKTPAPSMTVPSPKPTATPAPTSTPVPTATPTPTSTPTPTPMVPEGMEPYATVQMGEDVWYDLYENGVLVVRGTGATYDFKDGQEKHLYINRNVVSSDESVDENTFCDCRVLLIEEGITELGTLSLFGCSCVEKVIIPASLKKIGDEAFRIIGYESESIEWIGLDTEKVEIASTAFYHGKGIDSIPNIEKYSAMPTPTPTPSPTPIPNPDKPRLLETIAMGDNVTYEFWDNGYLYVKGSGAIPNQSELWGLGQKYYYPNSYTLAEKMHTVIVEEGITYFGKYCFSGVPADVEWFLPKTYTGGEEYSLSGGTVFHGYYNEKPVTVTRSKDDDWHKNLSAYDFFRVLEDEEYAAKMDVTITWE